MPSLLG